MFRMYRRYRRHCQISRSTILMSTMLYDFKRDSDENFEKKNKKNCTLYTPIVLIFMERIQVYNFGKIYSLSRYEFSKQPKFYLRLETAFERLAISLLNIEVNPLFLSILELLHCLQRDSFSGPP